MSDVILLTQGQVRKCEPISTAAAYRTDVATVVSQMEQDAKLWAHHYSTPVQALLWQQKAGVDKDTIKLELKWCKLRKRKVNPSLLTGQPSCRVVTLKARQN